MKRVLRKIFGGLNITWPKLIIFAVIMGVYTALMAMLVPDGNSFHDIAVTLEWWFLPAMIIVVNSKKPLEAALKTLVFFLISQPLVYLIQVPFNEMGWGLFQYYRYWFIVTLLTFPAGFIAWFVKKEKWYAGVILAVATVFLAVTGFTLAAQMAENFPNHLLTMIYCFGIIPVFILGILRDKWAKIIATVASVIAIVVMFCIGGGGAVEPFTVYNNTFLDANEVVLVGEPRITEASGGNEIDIRIIKVDEGNYTFVLSGVKSDKYFFTVADDENTYQFEYYFDEDLQAVVVNQI